jgi:hypothetical protein
MAGFLLARRFMRLITLHDFLMGRDAAYPSDFTGEIACNAAATVAKINQFLQRSGFDGHVNSGWRPPALNAATRGAARHSRHMQALACDLHDADAHIDQYCLDHPELLEELGLWQESPGSTPGWCHLQIVAPASGHRVFLP